MADRTGDPAVAVCFGVTVDDVDLGVFTACEGLSLRFEVTERPEGGLNGFVHQLPGRVSYSNVTLRRPVNADTPKVNRWLASQVDGVRRTTAEITAMTVEGTTVASWSLDGVVPVQWSAPSLSVDSTNVAVETLELAHHGFLDDGA